MSDAARQQPLTRGLVRWAAADGAGGPLTVRASAGGAEGGIAVPSGPRVDLGEVGPAGKDGGGMPRRDGDGRASPTSVKGLRTRPPSPKV